MAPRGQEGRAQAVSKLYEAAPFVAMRCPQCDAPCQWCAAKTLIEKSRQTLADIRREAETTMAEGLKKQARKEAYARVAALVRKLAKDCDTDNADCAGPLRHLSEVVEGWEP